MHESPLSNVLRFERYGLNGSILFFVLSTFIFSHIAESQNLRDRLGRNCENLQELGGIGELFRLLSVKKEYSIVDECTRELLQRNTEESLISYLHWIRLLLEHGQSSQAISLLEFATQELPTNANLWFYLGNAYGSVNRLDQAVASYHVALAIAPNHADAWHNAGIVVMRLSHRQRANLDAANVYVSTALRLAPIAPFLFNFGSAAWDLLGKPIRAVHLLIRAANQAPANVGYQHEAANLLLSLQHYRSACAFFDRILAVDPLDGAAHGGKGACLREQGHLEAAVAFFSTAAKLHPSVATWTNYGNILIETNHPEEAYEALTHALAIQPDSTLALSAAGSALAEMGDLPRAEALLRRAVSADPGSGLAWTNLGQLLRTAGDLPGAVAAGERAAALDPALAQNLLNLAEAVRLHHADVPRAERLLTAALAADPAHAGAACLAGFYRRLVCDWSQYDSDTASVRAAVAAADAARPGSALPLAVQALVFDVPPATHLAAAAAMAARVPPAGALPSRQRPAADDHGWAEPAAGLFWSLPAAAGMRRVRVGYLLGPIDQPVSEDVTAMARKHDVSRISFTFYFTAGAAAAPLRAAGDAEADIFAAGGGGEELPPAAVDLRGLSFGAAARQVWNDRIDVLVNVPGWAAGHAMEVLAWRPAAVQVSFKGFPGSTAAAWTDLCAADRVAAPPEHRGQFAERLLLLPAHYHVNGHCRRFGPPPTPLSAGNLRFEEAVSAVAAGEAQGPARDGERWTIRRAGVKISQGAGRALLPLEKVIFCSFNRPEKLDPTTWRSWVRILRRAPDSVLWLLRFEPAAEANLRRRAVEAGLAPDRLIFTDPLPAGPDEHRAKGAAHLFLDTFPYNAHGTAADALWARLPLLTLPGRHMAARVAASLLLTPDLPLPVLVARTPDDFERIALRLYTALRRAGGFARRSPTQPPPPGADIGAPGSAGSIRAGNDALVGLQARMGEGVAGVCDGEGVTEGERLARESPAGGGDSLRRRSGGWSTHGGGGNSVGGGRERRSERAGVKGVFDVDGWVRRWEDGLRLVVDVSAAHWMPVDGQESADGTAATVAAAKGDGNFWGHVVVARAAGG